MKPFLLSRLVPYPRATGKPLRPSRPLPVLTGNRKISRPIPSFSGTGRSPSHPVPCSRVTGKLPARSRGFRGRDEVRFIPSRLLGNGKTSPPIPLLSGSVFARTNRLAPSRHGVLGKRDKFPPGLVFFEEQESIHMSCPVSSGDHKKSSCPLPFDFGRGKISVWSRRFHWYTLSYAPILEESVDP